jgi:hypothetical protein
LQPTTSHNYNMSTGYIISGDNIEMPNLGGASGVLALNSDDVGLSAQTFTTSGDFVPYIFAAAGPYPTPATWGLPETTSAGSLVTITGAGQTLVQYIGNTAHYNATTGVWTAPVAGVYRVGAYLGSQNPSNSNIEQFTTQVFIVGNTVPSLIWAGTPNTSTPSGTFSCGGVGLVQLTAGQQLQLGIGCITSGTSTITIGNVASWFIEQVGSATQ